MSIAIHCTVCKRVIIDTQKIVEGTHRMHCLKDFVREWNNGVHFYCMLCWNKLQEENNE